MFGMLLVDCVRIVTDGVNLVFWDFLVWDVGGWYVWGGFWIETGWVLSKQHSKNWIVVEYQEIRRRPTLWITGALPHPLP